MDVVGAIFPLRLKEAQKEDELRRARQILVDEADHACRLDAARILTSENNNNNCIDISPSQTLVEISCLG